MKKIICQLTASIVLYTISHTSTAQNSLLVNFGTGSCTGSGIPAFSFIKDPLSLSPSQLINCSLAKQLPDIFAVFVAYNPKNNKVYVADIRSGIDTKIWVLDMGLPANISCPATIDSIPDYAYSYISNNFEFDNNGDLWSFSHYNDTVGQCNMDRFDVNTGNVINTRLVQFPAGHFPTSISSGDFTILPNGRMFATLGSFPSRLYEIKNYSSTTTNATAVFLDTLPQSCFGIAYLNGQLEITGTNFSGTCYYYKYDISRNIMDTATNFQNGLLPIDNTSITPSIGVTKRLLNAAKINDNTADLTYEIYVKNLGNVALNNINVSDNLAAVFGAQNVSDISVGFLTGANTANLVLNPAYNGNSDSELLSPGQNLANQIPASSDYFVKLRLGFRVTNLNAMASYPNSAIGTATIGSSGTLSFINVSDSSNNGAPDAVDPNNNGNPGEPGENIPTPFNFATLPVHFINITASFVDKTTAGVQWAVAIPTIISDRFEVEYSADGRNWNGIGRLHITNAHQSKYRFLHNNIPIGNLYYRIKETDADGVYIYSNIVLLRNKNTSGGVVVLPNPANNYLSITVPAGSSGKTQVMVYDAAGRQLTSLIMSTTAEDINTSGFPNGTYILKTLNNGEARTQKIVIVHR
ncbi:MAG: T9SS type A sorting domain-containing protein [Ginsengibacter sp.]